MDAYNRQIEGLEKRLATLENKITAMISLYRDVVVDNSKLEKRVRELEQAKNYRHRALLNNCVDNDEAILHKREIEEVKSDGS